MAYFAPAYTSVDFQFSSEVYAAPAYNAVDYSWVTVCRISTATFIDFLGVAAAQAVFTTTSSSTCYFETPHRDLSLSSGSTTNFVTWQRAVALESGSSILFRSGSSTLIYTGSAVNLSVIGGISTVAAVVSSSTTTFAQQNLVNRTALVKANTTTQFKGGRNYDMEIVVRGTTGLNFISSSLRSAAYTGATASYLSFRGGALFRASLSEYGASSANFSALTGVASMAVVPTYSATSFYGVPSIPGIAYLQGSSSAAFVSNYDLVSISPPPIEADCVFVKASTPSVFVIQ